MTTPESYTALRVRMAEAEQFRRLARRVAAAADRDVTQSDVLGAAVAYALEHVRDVAALLTEGGATPERTEQDLCDQVRQ